MRELPILQPFCDSARLHVPCVAAASAKLCLMSFQKLVFTCIMHGRTTALPGHQSLVLNLLVASCTRSAHCRPVGLKPRAGASAAVQPGVSYRWSWFVGLTRPTASAASSSPPSRFSCGARSRTPPSLGRTAAPRANHAASRPPPGSCPPPRYTRGCLPRVLKWKITSNRSEHGSSESIG
eukprot:COSAG05_NODE_1444_length_4871_cov_14.212070_6_plen_180_part_00